jgi:hypothetical protein
MAQYQQFDVFGASVAGELGQHLQDLPQEHIDQRGIHGWILGHGQRLAPDEPAVHSRCIVFPSPTPSPGVAAPIRAPADAGRPLFRRPVSLMLVLAAPAVIFAVLCTARTLMALMSPQAQ